MENKEEKTCEDCQGNFECSNPDEKLCFECYEAVKTEMENYIEY